MKNIIIISPHPDDETLGCGGTIVKKINEGYNVIIIVLTDGRHAFSKTYNIFQNPSPEELIEIRKKELYKSTNILGLNDKNIIFLNYEDGCLNKKFDELFRVIEKHILHLEPLEVYTTFQGDANTDHVIASKIIKKCIKKNNLKIRVFQYSIARTFSFLRPLQDLIFRYVYRNIEYVDITKYLDIKIKALNEIKSQIQIYAKGQKQPIITKAILNNHINNYEKYFMYKKS